MFSWSDFKYSLKYWRTIIFCFKATAWNEKIWILVEQMTFWPPGKVDLQIFTFCVYVQKKLKFFALYSWRRSLSFHVQLHQVKLCLSGNIPPKKASCQIVFQIDWNKQEKCVQGAAAILYFWTWMNIDNWFIGRTGYLLDQTLTSLRLTTKLIVYLMTMLVLPARHIQFDKRAKK